MSEKICAVVVTFNRKNLLIECLNSLLRITRPLDAIFIIDNFSSDGTPQKLLEEGFIDSLPPENLTTNHQSTKTYSFEVPLGFLDNGVERQDDKFKHSLEINYVRMNGNTGGAGGFYEGVKRSHETGYDWIWLMDDDAEPYADSLAILSEYFHDKDVVGLAGTVIEPDGSISLMHRGMVDYNNLFPCIQKPLALDDYKKRCLDIKTASFVGFLVSSKAVDIVGYPIKEYFIHNDDIEYSLRLLTVGKIKLIPESKILHKEAAKKESQEVPLSRLWLTYYGRRNLISLAKKHSTNKPIFYWKVFFAILISIAVAIIKGKKGTKIRQVHFHIARTMDGLTDTFDNDKPKRILKII